MLALDQSTRVTGWAAFDGTDLLRWDVIVLPQSVPAEQRIVEMMHQIEVVIQRYRPKMIVLEDVQKQASERTVILLARLQGLIISLCDRYQIPYTMYFPTRWRKQLGFSQGAGVSRDACKQQALDFIRNAYGLKVGEDICEAICIGLAHLRVLGMLPNLNELRRAHDPRDYKEAKDGKGVENQNRRDRKSKEA